MPRTIEIASTHKGRIATKVKGESVTVEFKDMGDVGLALCTNDEAGAFLSIGLPDYWKTKVDADAGLADADKAKTPNAATMIEHVRASETTEALEAVIAAEVEIGVVTGNGPRKSVMDEAAKRSKALAPKE
jgi:hypothetical protein